MDQVAQELLVEKKDGVAVLTLNRPERLNALNPSLMAALTEAMIAVAQDAAVGCVVVTGAGRGFCSGGDLETNPDAAAAAPDDHPESVIERRVNSLRRGMEASRLLHVMPKPTIAMVNGPVAGAGIGLAGACDLRFAAQSATFLSAFERIGSSGDYGSSWFWTKILGTAKARELFFLSEKMTAEAALAFGLYHRVFADDALRARTLEAARRLADGPRPAWRYMKANLNGALETSFERSLDQEALNMVLSSRASARRLKERRDRGKG